MKASTEKYFEAVGRRKCSVARVRIWPTTGTKSSVVVNEKDIKEYWNTADSRQKVMDLVNRTELKDKIKVSIKVNGGGMSSQVDAAVLGIARALTKLDAEMRKPLKKEGHLSRDPRVKERRKFGLKKARKAPQWSKR
ncbi:MAG: 30S ribosomal protein S9 [Parcubacteria group bacterium GW2011_GWF2_38_76]|nr:MAG: 30S ribosomal protein S9 [Parcubacteria group bacterium GW2011_GWF2_38_76]HBM46009.1 30S ribosomal protein S9 [Patescibacteria group bacterium]